MRDTTCFKCSASGFTLRNCPSLFQPLTNTFQTVRHSHEVQPWTFPTVQLANSVACSPTGVVWLNSGLQGKRFYHRFVIIPDLSSPLILEFGMEFMLGASVSVHIPSRTATLVESTPQEVLSEWLDAPELDVLARLPWMRKLRWLV